jgi:4-hydroxy-tetrahydrodipicolinate reductase
MSVQIGLLGRGRMGKVLESLLQGEFAEKTSLTTMVGKSLTPETYDTLKSSQVIIDFSSPEAVLALMGKLRSEPNPTALPAFIVASTGWKLDQRKELEKYGQLAALLISANFSLGVLALMDVLKTASPLLEKLGYLPVISETHHRHKKDSPSGTALSLQRVIAPAGPGNVQTHSTRGGEIIGDHEVTFYGVADHLTFGHFAQDRSIFARGAIEAALWISKKTRANVKGILSMDAFFHDRTSV